MKFVHCADIHLDSPLRGLSRYPDAPVQALRGATRRAMENLVELAIAEGVAFVLIAGDLYDGQWQDFNTGLFFVAQMGRLARHGIQVVMVRGNHDADSRLTVSLPLPGNVAVLSSKKPETHLVGKVAIHGQSFSEAATTADLAAGYPMAWPGYLNIGLLHTCLNGREGHADYAPCSLDTLLSKGYDYWALGHVHAREVLHEAPWVVFPGNLQGRHARETGSKGCELVTVEDGAIVAVEHRPVDVFRWHRLELDVTGSPTAAAVLERLALALRDAVQVAGGRPVAVRVVLRGRCAAHAELLRRPEQLKEDVRALALGSVDGEVWIEKVQLDTQPDGATGLERDDALAELGRLVEAVERQPALATELADCWQDLLRKLPPELATEELFDFSDPWRRRTLLSQVQSTLLARLLEVPMGAAGRNEVP